MQISVQMAEMAETGEWHVLCQKLPHFAQPFLKDGDHPGWRQKLAK